MNCFAQTLLSCLFLMPFCGSFASYFVKLESDSPAVLDAPIIFTGRLLGQSHESPATFRWRWNDNASPGHFNESEADPSVTVRNYTLIYPTEKYEAAKYKMTLTIYEYYGLIYWREIGSATVTFRITRELNGRLDVNQTGIKPGTGIVSCVKETNLNVVFHDPSNYLKNAKIHYFWFINTVNYGQTQTGVFSYNFTDPQTYNVEVTAIAYFNQNSSSSQVVVSDPEAAIRSVENDLDRSSEVKLGIFQRELIAKLPITNMTVTGSVMLKHGQLVDLNIKCNGTADWKYCWSIKEKGYNITGNETCEDPSVMKNSCDFSIIWYFGLSDTYNFLVEITNDVSSHIEVIPVTIYDVASSLPLSIIVIPVASSIVVVIIIMSAIALYAHYKTRLAVEVADFDFGQAEEEELQAKTFWERLRESFGNAFTSGSETASQGGSSVSGRRSVQMPGPAGIGYGSIT